MTEQTKAVFENPQLLREKLGEYFDTTNQNIIEYYAHVAQKMFNRGKNQRLKMYNGWNWSVFCLWLASGVCGLIAGLLVLADFKNAIFALWFIMAGLIAMPLFLFYRGCTIRAIVILLPLIIMFIMLLSPRIPFFEILFTNSTISGIILTFVYGIAFVSGLMTTFLPLHANQYVILRFEKVLDKGFEKSGGKKTKNVIIMVIVYFVLCSAFSIFLYNWIKSYNIEDQAVAKNEISNNIEKSENIDNSNANEINPLLLASDEQFCESGRAWLSYLSLLKHDAKIDENVKAAYEEIKSVDNVPAKTMSNKGSVVVCSFEGLDGMSVEYVNKKVNKVLLNGEWVETNDYEKTYELDERVYKFTPINKQEVQKFAKTAINNMKLIINDLQGFRSAGYYEGELMPWGKFTTAELKTNDGKMATGTKITDSVYLAVGDMNDCIEVNFNPRVDEFSGAVSFLPNSNASGICKEVLKDSKVKEYLKSFNISAYGE